MTPTTMQTICQIVIFFCVFIGAIATFGNYYYGKKASDQNSHVTVSSNIDDDKVIASSIMVSVMNDLKYSIPVAESIQDGIRKKDFIPDPDLFESLYSPNVSLPSQDKTIHLHSNVQSLLDEYKRRLDECSKHRATYLQKLREKSYDKIETCLLIYCIALDSVVKTGMKLLTNLNKQYPGLEQSSVILPSYNAIDMNELTKAIGGSIQENAKNVKAKQSDKEDHQ